MTFAFSAGRFIYRFLEAVFLLVALWLLLSQLLPRFRMNSAFVQPDNGIAIFIRSNGVHTDFVLPVHTSTLHWDTVFPRETFKADSGFRFIAIGWGDKGFFLNTPTWGDLTFSTAFTAASGIGESALHVDYLRFYPSVGRNVKRFVISEKQYTLLINYIIATMQLQDGAPTLIQHAGYGKHDLFYEANGRYSLFMTCNEWTGDGMEACGLPVGIWTPLEFGIMQE